MFQLLSLDNYNLANLSNFLSCNYMSFVSLLAVPFAFTTNSRPSLSCNYNLANLSNSLSTLFLAPLFTLSYKNSVRMFEFFVYIDISKHVSKNLDCL